MTDTKDLRYERVTLLVPYHDGEEADPGRWDWMDLLDTNAPVPLISSDPVPAAEARTMLSENGFGDPGDLADQLADD
jgi:hypothetical protein